MQIERLKNRFRMLMALWLVLALFCGCPAEPVSVPAPEPVTVGAIYPFTGPSASSGEDIRAGIELGVELVNNVHDLQMPLAPEAGIRNRRKIRLIFRDSQSDDTAAARAVEELVEKEGVVAILGCYNSSVTASASEQAEMKKVPFINGHSTSPILIRRGLRWFFRTTPDDEIFSENFFTFFSDMLWKEGLSIPRRIVLVYENRLWGTSVSNAERKIAMKLGYEIIGDFPYEAAATSFEDILSAIARLTPPYVIFQSSYAEDALALVRGYAKRNIRPTAILGMDAGFNSPEFIPELGPLAEGILSREVWALDIAAKKPLLKPINDIFKARYGRDMTGHAARAFTALMTLAHALNRAETLDPESIRQALVQTDIPEDQVIMPWEGVRFDPETGQNILGKGIIVQVQDGKYRTVWPKSLKERPLIWNRETSPRKP